MTTRKRCGAVVLILAAAVRIPAGENLKGNPLSPGAAALLLDGRVTEAELSRWTELLADERPRWRATGARLAAVSGATPLVPALVAALEKETQPSAVREEMTALGLLAPGAADEVLFRAAERFPQTLDGHLARSLALRGRAALALAPRLSGLTVDLPSWGAYFAWATGDGRRHLDEATSAALSTGAPAAWAAVLRLARDAEHVIEEATLARSLESPSAGVREATYWHLVLSGYPRPDARSALALALAGAPDALDSAGGLALLGHEIVGRTFGRPARDPRRSSRPSRPASACDCRTRLRCCGTCMEKSGRRTGWLASGMPGRSSRGSRRTAAQRRA